LRAIRNNWNGRQKEAIRMGGEVGAGTPPEWRKTIPANLGFFCRKRGAASEVADTPRNFFYDAKLLSHPISLKQGARRSQVADGAGLWIVFRGHEGNRIRAQKK